MTEYAFVPHQDWPESTLVGLWYAGTDVVDVITIGRWHLLCSSVKNLGERLAKQRYDQQKLLIHSGQGAVRDAVGFCNVYDKVWKEKNDPGRDL